MKFSILSNILLFLSLPIFVNAQTIFQDSFTDGDFTNNPQWSGDVLKYTVIGNELRINDLGFSGSASLYSSLSIRDSISWEFLVRTNLTTAGPSSTNRVRVYLQADNSNFASATLNGYYLQFGETGSLDALEIYKVTNGASTRILRGTDATVATAVINCRIKIIRSSTGVWELFADHTGGSTFVSEGTVTDNTHTSGSFFGVYTTYTTTQGDRFFYDDFVVSPLFVDNTPPVLLSASAINNTTVDVLFDEPLDPTTANLSTNYSINNGINVISAVLDGSNPALVHLTVSPLVSQTTYQLTVVNVEDIGANAIASVNTSFYYVLIVPATPQDVIFNELMVDPNPVVALPDAEYVELYNRSSNAIDLSGYQLIHRSASSGTETNRTLTAFVLLPGEYLLLHNDTSFLSLPNDLMVPSFPALNNTSAYMILKNPGGIIIDSILYEYNWYKDGTKDDGGWSLELINPNLLCREGSNWMASNNINGGTPGLQNSVFSNLPDLTGPALLTVIQQGNNSALLTFNESLDSLSAVNISNYSVNGLTVISAQLLIDTTVLLTFSANMLNNTIYTVAVTNVTDCSANSQNTQGQFTYILILPGGFQDIIFNELMIDPDPVVNLPNAEFIELFNRNSFAIDLGGYTITHRSASSTTETTRVLGNFILLSGQYLILHNNVDYLSANNDLQIASFPALNNTSAYLILRDAGGNLIDSILYSNDWYQSTLKDDGGWSLELINPNLICKGANNWIASNSNDGGTPGTTNSVLDNTVDTIPLTAILARQSDINKAVIVFDDILDQASALNTSNYSINNGLNVIFVQILDQSSVELTFNANMLNNITYTISMNNISDCVGNTDTINAAFEYLELSSATHYDIIINEIFPDANPVVGLPEQEFIEIYNRSNKNINLEGSIFSDGTSSEAIFPFYIIKPNQHLIIYEGGGESYSAFGNILEFSVFPDLDVSGDDLVLMDRFGKVLDAVSYSSDWHINSTKAEGGWTLERINPNRPCEGRENWSTSVAQPPAYTTVGGTPGQPNSLLQAQPDLAGPDLYRAYPFAASVLTNGDSIRLFFSEAVGDSSALILSAYSINNGLDVVAAYVESPFYNTVVIVTDVALVLGTTYTLTIANTFTDCIGNPVSINNSVSFAKTSPIENGDIIINEILYNPVVGGVDYLELYNKTNKVLNVGDLWVSNTEGSLLNDANDVKIDYLLFPNQYVVLTAKPIQVEQTYRNSDPDKTPDFTKMVEVELPSFADDAGNVVLYTINNQVANFVDSFSYSEDLQSPLIDDLNGVSLERIDFDAPTNETNNWHSAAQALKFGTPTYQNSSAVSNEITDDGIIQLPRNTLSPDGDGFEDFLLINYNIDDIGFVGNFSVYDAHGRFVKQLINNELLMREGTVQWDGTNEAGEKALVGPYIIFSEIFNPDGQVKRYKKTCILAAKF